MVEGMLTELSEVLEPLSNTWGIMEVKCDIFNQHEVVKTNIDEIRKQHQFSLAVGCFANH